MPIFKMSRPREHSCRCKIDDAGGIVAIGKQVRPKRLATMPVYMVFEKSLTLFHIEMPTLIFSDQWVQIFPILVTLDFPKSWQQKFSSLNVYEGKHRYRRKKTLLPAFGCPAFGPRR